MANNNTKRNRKLNPTVAQPRKTSRAKVAAREQTGDNKGPSIADQMKTLGYYKLVS